MLILSLCTVWSWYNKNVCWESRQNIAILLSLVTLYSFHSHIKQFLNVTVYDFQDIKLCGLLQSCLHRTIFPVGCGRPN